MITSPVVRFKNRKLLIGEFVEVRQKELGLRGSWQPGVVVKVWLGHRSVQYDELLSKTGKRKLRECIPVPIGVEGGTSIPHYVSKLPAQNDRGFIRPRPPPCTEMSRESWKKGLCVDAFYEDAWWEGVLMEGLSGTSDDTQVRVFFPDEGDQVQISLKDLRVSQEWDAKASIWFIKGYTVTGQTGESLLTLEPNEDVQIMKGSSVKTRSAFGSQVHGEQYQSQQVLFPSIDCGLHGATDAMTSNNYTGFDKPSHKYLEKEETLAEWVKTAKQQALGEKLLDKSSRDVVMEDNNVNQEATKKSIAHIRKPLRKNSKNKSLVPLKGKARSCKSSTPLSFVMIQGARERAKKTLAEAGWIIRFRSPDSTKVALYISPEGQRHCRLSAACAEWRRLYGSGVDIKTLKENGIFQVLKAEKLKLLKASQRRFTQMNNKFLRSSRKMDGRARIRPTSSSQGRQYRQSFETSIRPMSSKPNKLPLASHGHHIKSSSKRRVHLHGFNLTKQVPRKRKLSAIPKSSSKPRKSQLHTLDFSDGRKRKSNACKQSSRKIVKALCKLNVSEGRSRKRKHGVLEENRKQIVIYKRRRRASEVTNTTQLSNRSLSRARGHNRLEVLSTPGRGKADDGSAALLSKRTIISWLIDMGVVTENEKVTYLNKKDKHVMMEGHVTRDGILCRCCRTVLTLSNFESHAGSKLHRPCANIYVADGRSLSECQMQALTIKDATKPTSKVNKETKNGDLDGSDDTCGICGDGGELICCDHCPATLHLNCVQIENVPEGEWYCPHCQCAVCGSSQFTDGESSDERTVLYCDQCGRKYHVACLHAKGVPKMQLCPEMNWFCGNSCEKIFEGLHELVGTTNPLKGGFSWTLLRSSEDDQFSTTENALEVYAEHNSKLALALSIMQECFRPMVDYRTQIEFISNILYNRGSELKRMNFRGFYTVILERGDELISVASIRVHGSRLAEMPLIGTRFQYRRQGMCRRLMSALEEMLRCLQVEILVLPAVPELLETWTNAFGFKSMSAPERLQFVDLSIVAFPGTTILQKILSNTQSDTVELNSSTSHPVDAPWNDLQGLLACFNSHGGKRRPGRPPKKCAKNYAAFRSKTFFEGRRLNNAKSNKGDTLQNRTAGALKDIMVPILDHKKNLETGFGDKDNIDAELSSHLERLKNQTQGSDVFSAVPEKANAHMLEVMEQDTSREEKKAHNNNCEDNNHQEIGTIEDKNGSDLNLKEVLREFLTTLIADGVNEMPVACDKQGTQIKDDSSVISQGQCLYSAARVSGYSINESKKQLNMTENYHGCEGDPSDMTLSKNINNSKLSNEDVRIPISTIASNSITCSAADVLTSRRCSPQSALLGTQACIIGMQTLRSGRILLRKSLDQSQTASSENEFKHDPNNV